MIELANIYLVKAEESLAGAESEFVNTRYNNCANRCYYSAFQAAIAALIREGISPSRGPQEQWSHKFVQASFATELIRRRKRYPASMRDSLSDLLLARHTADYKLDNVTERQASRAIQTARQLVEAVGAGGGESA